MAGLRVLGVARGAADVGLVGLGNVLAAVLGRVVRVGLLGRPARAVRHTKDPAALRVRWAAGVLRVGAWDADPGPPEPPGNLDALTGAEEGRGLALVRAGADLWGWQLLARGDNRGKYVWCDLVAA
ncbi:ATP-binding protein [Streptomyces tendae]|uniref:ATP-binding protein n=1 Tax=Streptomyces tendae TaxID=1932 RepID=UPI00371E1F7F